MKIITVIHDIILEIKTFTVNLGLLVGMSFVSNFWNALKNEFNIIWWAHLFALIIGAIIVGILKRWIVEHIDEMSDVEFMHDFTITNENTFNVLKTPITHGTIYRQNISARVYDTNKLKVTSRFMMFKTVETFEVTSSEFSVKLKNISGKYESEVVYELAEGVIIGHWKANPKGIRRALGLFFSRMAERSTIEDFQKFIVNYESKIE